MEVLREPLDHGRHASRIELGRIGRALTGERHPHADARRPDLPLLLAVREDELRGDPLGGLVGAPRIRVADGRRHRDAVGREVECGRRRRIEERRRDRRSDPARVDLDAVHGRRHRQGLPGRADARIPGLAVSALGECRELGREAIWFEAQEGRHHDGSGQLPNAFERLVEARATATHRSGPIEHAVEVDLAADDGVRDDGIAGPRAHGDGPVLELAQRRAERDAGIGAAHAADVDAADLDARQDAIHVCLAERDHTQRDQQDAQQRAEHEAAGCAPGSRDTQRSDHRSQRTGDGHRVIHLTGTRAIPASGDGSLRHSRPGEKGVIRARSPAGHAPNVSQSSELPLR